jgi:hypothetical protein
MFIFMFMFMFEAVKGKTKLAQPQARIHQMVLVMVRQEAGQR